MTYTCEEIMALDAAQLRLAIAEALGMKYRVSDGNMDFICGDRLHREFAAKGDPIAVQPCIHDPDNRDNDHEDLLPDWPASISAAWGLVEEMYQPRLYRSPENKDWCCVGLTSLSGDVYAWETTAPLAIARAWLLWKSQ